MRTQNAQRQNEKEEKTERSVFLFDFFCSFFPAFVMVFYFSVRVAFAAQK